MFRRPTEPDSTARDGLIYTLAKLRDIGHTHHKILITKAPPSPQTEAQKLREELQADNISIFTVDIPLLAAFKKASALGTTIAQVKADHLGDTAKFMMLCSDGTYDLPMDYARGMRES